MTTTESSSQGVESVHAQLREAILSGALAPGEVVSQVVIANQLGVSRTPLRGALRMLQAEGLIESEPNRRVRIAPLSLADAEQLCAVRVTLESAAIRISVPRLTPENIGALEGYMAEMTHFSTMKDYDRWYVPHRAFHRALIVHAGLRFENLIAPLFEHAERYRRLQFGRGPREQGTLEHRAILDACKEGERDLAALRLVQHLARTEFEILELVDNTYEPTLLRQVLADLGVE